MIRRITTATLVLLSYSSAGCSLIYDFEKTRPDAAGASAGGRSDRDGSAGKTGVQGGSGGSIESRVETGGTAGRGNTNAVMIGGVAGLVDTATLPGGFAGASHVSTVAGGTLGGASTGGVTTQQAGTTAATIVIGGTAGVGSGGASLGGVASTGGAANGGVAGSGGTTSTGGVGTGFTSAVCTDAQTRSCALSGAIGSCAAGTQTCSGGLWSACSIVPATTDNCIAGNDDNCNGKPNETACKAIQLTVGPAHSCALLSDGMVRCWGGNSTGQLGNGKTAHSAKPELVSGLRNVKAIDAGGETTCAILEDGSLKCWGDNESGQLGPSVVTKTSTTPVTVALPNGVRAAAVSVGDNHTCIISESDRSVWCWGLADSGQLGNGDPAAGTVKSPVAVAGLSGVLALSAGLAVTCAALSSGAAQCWGSGTYGKNGDSSAVDAPVPRSIVAGGHFPLDAVEITNSPSGQHSCLLRARPGNAACWGDNFFGQLGNGDSDTTGANGVGPVLAADGTSEFPNIVSISAGSSHTCAVLGDGTGVCWGNNNSGQIGNAVFRPTAPFPVYQLTNIQSIGAGGTFSCALLNDGAVWCWGDNAVGQLGVSSVTSTNAPTKVIDLLP